MTNVHSTKGCLNIKNIAGFILGGPTTESLYMRVAGDLAQQCSDLEKTESEN